MANNLNRTKASRARAGALGDLYCRLRRAPKHAVKQAATLARRAGRLPQPRKGGPKKYTIMAAAPCSRSARRAPSLASRSLAYLPPAPLPALPLPPDASGPPLLAKRPAAPRFAGSVVKASSTTDAPADSHRDAIQLRWRHANVLERNLPGSIKLAHIMAGQISARILLTRGGFDGVGEVVRPLFHVKIWPWCTTPFDTTTLFTTPSMDCGSKLNCAHRLVGHWDRQKGAPYG